MTTGTITITITIPIRIAEKKYLTTFSKSGIGLKNSNFFVFFFHKSKKKGGEDFGGVVVVNSVSGIRYHETRFTDHKIKEEEKR